MKILCEKKSFDFLKVKSFEIKLKYFIDIIQKGVENLNSKFKGEKLFEEYKPEF